MKIRFSRFLFSIYLLLCTATMMPVHAQNFKATIVGQVTDSTGGVIPGANITIVGEGTEQAQSVMTDEEGNYTITQLTPGRYELRVEAVNFRRVVQTGLVLETDQTARANITLEAGNVTETVTVTAETPIINTDTGAKGEVITNRQVQDLPLNGRNFTDLALLVPGIYRRPDESDQGQGVSSSGSRTDASNYILDGVTNRSDRVGGVGVNTSVDSIREFKVLTNSYSAEFGRTAGAQINVVSKSGTNQFNGSIFDYVRNDYFDAKNALGFDVPSTPVDESDKTLRRNQFGATIGGPLPFFNFGEGGPVFNSGRDRTFFFVSYEGTRESRSQVVNNIAPNAAFLRGDFSTVLGAGPDLIRGTADDVANSNRIFDPATTRPNPNFNATRPVSATNPQFIRDAFPGNIIPESRFSPAARQILAFVPAANVPGTLADYVATGVNRNEVNQFSVKVDHRFSTANNAYARYSIQSADATLAFPNNVFFPGFGNTNSPRAQSFAVSDTHIFSTRVVNEARFGFFSQNGRLVPQNSSTDFNALFGIPGVSPGGVFQGFPNIAIDGLPVFGDRPTNPQIFDLKNYQFYDTLNLVVGNQTIKFGADIVRSNFAQSDVNSLRGNFRFRGRNTNVAGLTAAQLPGTSTGFRSFADFLLGLPDTALRQVGVVPTDLSGYQLGFFVQDDWRVSPRLTLNLGLRYELQTPLKEADDNLSNFIPALGRVACARPVSDAQGQQLCSPEGLPVTLVRTDKNNFGPRVGFALRLFNDDRTVVRGGAGIFYSLETFNSIRGQLSGGFPFTASEQVTRLASDTPTSFTLTNPFPAGRSRLQGLTTPTGLATDLQSPVIYQYNLTIEREIVRDLALEVGYVGSQSRFLGRRFNVNQTIPAGFNPVTGLLNPQPFPFPTLGTIVYQESTGNSNYNALQTSLRRRATAGLTLLASYTFSRSIDTTSSTGQSTQGAQINPQNIYDIRAERALSDFHRKHQFSTSFNYELPFGRGRRFFTNAGGLTNALLGGLQVNGIVTLLSGRPFTPQFTTGDFATQRPDIIGDPYANIPEGLYFNPAAFARPVASAADPDLFGNAGRNILTTPGFRSVDLSLINNIRLNERVQLQLRAEAFNAFNHPNFLVPAFRLDNSNVGRVTQTANEGRELQFAAKIIF